MPHIVIEYSDNLGQNIKQSNLMTHAHQAVLDSALFSPDAVKARSLAYTDYVLPEGANSFIHITVSILQGRSVEERLSLSTAVFKVAQDLVSNADKISVDIHEMNTETYRK